MKQLEPRTFYGHVHLDDANPREWTVEVEEPNGRGKRLDPFLDEVNHSPDGFSWGYHGSGPAQLAYAILREHLGVPELARRCYQRFKETTVALWAQEQSWEFTGDEINERLRRIIEEDETGELRALFEAEGYHLFP